MSKSEGRNPKSEKQINAAPFGFRNSAFFRVSAFGIRSLCTLGHLFSYPLRIAAPLLALPHASGCGISAA
jgi:hypothetical protein